MIIERHHSNQRMSQMVVHNGTVYLAGQVDQQADADVGVQTQRILQQIDTYLAEVGTDKGRVLSAMIWLSDIRYFQQMNAVWDDWVADGNPPARACVEARLARPELLVEIQVVAALP